jgi:hypothetical protein
MFMRKLLPILLALLFNAPAFAQIQLENGLPINVETNRVTLNELDKGEDFYFSEVTKFNNEYFVVSKSLMNESFVIEKFGEELELIKSIDLSEVLHVNENRIIETKSLKDRLIIVTLSVNKKEKNQTCNAYTFTYENMSLNQKVELKTQYYKKQKMKAEIITSHNDNILFKVSEAENKEHYSYISHFILTDNNLEIINDYSDLINKEVTSLLKKGVFVLTPNIVLSNSNEVIMAGLTRNPDRTYFSGFIFKYNFAGAVSYDFEDKLPWGLSDDLVVKLDVNGVLYGANYSGENKENFVFFTFNTESMEPIVLYSKETDDNIGMTISNIIPLANNDVMVIEKKIQTTSLDNVHSTHFSVNEIEISKIDENGSLTFQKTITLKSSIDRILMDKPVACIVNDSEVTLVYNSIQYHENDKALVGSVIDENNELSTFKIAGYDTEEAFFQLYQVNQAKVENMEVIGLTWLENAAYELVLISSE